MLLKQRSTVVPSESHAGSRAAATQAERPLDILFGAGALVFEANVGGRTEIYFQRKQDKADRLIFSSRAHCLFPSPSPCGRYIAYAEAESESRTAAARIMLFDVQTRASTEIAEEGTFPSFSSDGETVYYEYRRKLVCAVNVTTGEQRTIFDPAIVSFGDYQIAKARVSADERYVFVTSDRGGRWNVWRICTRTREVMHVGRGCEPVALGDGERVAWVSPRGRLAGTEVVERDLRQSAQSRVLGPCPGRFQYYPSLADNERFLLCSISGSFSLLRRATRYRVVAADRQNGVIDVLRNALPSCRWARWLKLTFFPFALQLVDVM